MKHLTNDEIAELSVDLNDAVARKLLDLSKPHQSADECPVCYSRAEVVALMSCLAGLIAYVVLLTTSDPDEALEQVLATFRATVTKRMAEDKPRLTEVPPIIHDRVH